MVLLRLLFPALCFQANSFVSLSTSLPPCGFRRHLAFALSTSFFDRCMSFSDMCRLTEEIKSNILFMFNFPAFVNRKHTSLIRFVFQFEKHHSIAEYVHIILIHRAISIFTLSVQPKWEHIRLFLPNCKYISI